VLASIVNDVRTNALKIDVILFGRESFAVFALLRNSFAKKKLKKGNL